MWRVGRAHKLVIQQQTISTEYMHTYNIIRTEQVILKMYVYVYIYIYIFLYVITI